MAYRDDLNVLRRLKAEEEAAMLAQFANVQGGSSTYSPEFAAYEEQGDFGARPDFGNVRSGVSSVLQNVLRPQPQQPEPMPQVMPRTAVEDPRRWQSEPGSDLPMNSFRVESGPDAGKTRSLNFADINPAWGQQSNEPQPDYSQPIEIAGMGKGYWEKGGTGNAIVNGKLVKLGVDRKKTWENMKTDQALRKGEMDIARDQEAINASQAARTMREDTTTQAALEKRYGKPQDGMRWTLDGRPEPIPGNKKEQAGQTTLALLDEADKLLDKSTGSLVGAGWDALVGAFGQSNEGADAIAQLKPIAGQLVSMMPRMEGPQSNYDVKLYQEMAGQLADPTVPVQRRKAAAAKIRELNMKYATPEQAAAPPAALIQQARDAIAKGAPREAVLQRLRQHGITSI